MSGAVIQPVILAAGKGTRIMVDAMAAGLGERPKVLYPIHNKLLIDYVLDVVAEAGKQLAKDGEIEFAKPILVVNFMQELVREHVGDRAIYVEQLPAPLGTGHAVQVTESAVDPRAVGVLVMNGDMPAWHPETVVELAKGFIKERPTISLATVDFTDPHYTPTFFAYGRLVRDAAGQPTKIQEQTDASPEELAITECNPSLYVFDRQWVFPALHQIKSNNSLGQYYLTDLLGMAFQEGHPVHTQPCRDWREALGVNTFDQLKLCAELLR